MATLIRIDDWDVHFENNRSRGIESLSWVPIPNKQDGDGYTELLDHPDGASHFGAWIGIVQVASKCHPRGTLVRSTGVPHNSRTLERITRIHREVFEAAIPRLAAIGWITLEDHGSSSNGDAQAPAPQPLADGGQPGASSGQAGAGETHPPAQERKGNEKKDTRNTSGAGGTKPAASAGPFVEDIVFPCVRGQRSKETEWRCPIAFRDELASAYPAVNVPSHLRKAKLWLESNPSRRKTAAGMPEFLRRWMERNQNRGGDRPPDGKSRYEL